MEFGVLKSKIEKVLTESYADKKKFKNNMFLFNELVVKNKNINKIFYLYDELSTNKGLNEDIASEFINCPDIIGMHYDTFGYIKINQEEAIKKFAHSGKQLTLMNIGETIQK